jgi:hypothetical protein
MLSSSSACSRGREHATLPQRLVDRYREVLKAYIIMGSGHLQGELSELADLLVSAGAPACDALRLHNLVLDEVIQGLGNRSARHVMNRASLLALEMFLEMAERYRLRSAVAADSATPAVLSNEY